MYHVAQDHPTVAATLNSLAILYTKNGQFKVCSWPLNALSFSCALGCGTFQASALVAVY